jgi:ketosteroid isomerase-like protein
VEFLDPMIEWRMPPNFPEAGTYRGRDEVKSRLEEFLESWVEFRIEVEELIDAGDGVVALTRFKGRSKGVGLTLTGVAVDAQVWTLSEGKVVRVWMYGGTEDALAAAGLPQRTSQ